MKEVRCLDCPIYISQGVLLRPDVLLSKIAAQQVFMITNEIIAPHYLDKLKQSLNGLQYDAFVLPDGEKHKSLDTYQKIIATLIEKKHQRTTTIIALGGGVVGDIAGFVASTYQRGVRFIQMPTSLLAQVDAAIGGKTALNVSDTKNMIGTFYQPHAVFVDLKFLKTLPEREFRSGLAEVFKHALIADKSYFDWLLENGDKILAQDEKALQHMIQRSIEIKAHIVNQDEKDKGLRHVLNFGHTIGHAIEAASHYELLHGEAVAIGMVEELKLSPVFEADQLEKTVQWLTKAGLLKRSKTFLKRDLLMPYLSRDKKRLNNALKLPCIDRVGECRLIDSSLGDLLARMPTVS